MSNRSRNADIDQRLWHTQLELKRNAGISGALFLARGCIGAAVARNNGKVALLALDLEKAFDSIMMEPMLMAISRFGASRDFSRDD